MLSFRVWLRRLRSHLPVWRSILGVASIAAFLMSFLAVAFPFSLGTLGVVSGFSFAWADFAAWSVAASIVLGIALKGTSRVEILLADLLLVVLLFPTY